MWVCLAPLFYFSYYLIIKSPLHIAIVNPTEISFIVLYLILLLYLFIIFKAFRYIYKATVQGFSENPKVPRLSDLIFTTGFTLMYIFGFSWYFTVIENVFNFFVITLNPTLFILFSLVLIYKRAYSNV